MKLHFTVVDKKQCSHHYSYHIIKETVSADGEFYYITLAKNAEIVYRPDGSHLVGIGRTEWLEVVRADKVLTGNIQLFIVDRIPAAVKRILVKWVSYLGIVNKVDIFLAAAVISCMKIVICTFAWEYRYILRQNSVQPENNSALADGAVKLHWKDIFVCMNSGVCSGAAKNLGSFS